jgi:hypothetical protein
MTGYCTGLVRTDEEQEQMLNKGGNGKDAGSSPANIEFWVAEARILKEAADSCWSADISVKQRVKQIKRFSKDASMVHAAEGAESELNLLYRYLVALAIQYLAIGILIRRDPQRFLKEQPGHHIVSLIEESSVTLSPLQKSVLLNIESYYEWGDRYPQLSGQLTDPKIRMMTHQMAAQDALSLEDKKALDEVYAKLNEFVQGDMK